MIKVGDVSASKLFVGESSVSRVYRGESMVWSTRSLPNLYTPLQYIKSTGTQYIDTGFYPIPNKITVDMDVMQTDNLTTTTAMLGVRLIPDANNGSSVNVFQSISGRNAYRFDITSNIQFTTIMDTRVNILLDWYEYVFKYGRSNISNLIEKSGQRLNKPFYLFTFQTNGSFTIQHGKYRLYYCKLYDDGVIVRDYVPALDPDGKPCLYDFVTAQPFYNDGTGQFEYSLT